MSLISFEKSQEYWISHICSLIMLNKDEKIISKHPIPTYREFICDDTMIPEHRVVDGENVVWFNEKDVESFEKFYKRI